MRSSATGGTEEKAAKDTMRTSRPRARSKGFTLVEVITAIAVFAVLVALLVPASLSMQRRMRRSRERAVEVVRVHQEAQRFLITGEVSSDAFVGQGEGCVRISASQGEPDFALEVPR